VAIRFEIDSEIFETYRDLTNVNSNN